MIVYLALLALMALNSCDTAIVNQKPADRRVIKQCTGSDAILPFDYSLSPGDKVDVFTWFFNNRRVADYAKKHLAVNSEYFGRVALRGLKDENRAQIMIKNMTKKDTGVYSLRIKGTRANGSNFTLTRNLTMDVTDEVKTPKLMLWYKLGSANLFCGKFILKQKPNFDVQWVSPSGKIMPSSGYDGGIFNLLLPSLEEGKYTCRLSKETEGACLSKDLEAAVTVPSPSAGVAPPKAKPTRDQEQKQNTSQKPDAPPKAKPTSDQKQEQNASQKPDEAPPKDKPTSDQEQEQDASQKPDASPPKDKPTSDQEQEQKTSPKLDAAPPKGKPTSDQEQEQNASQKPDAAPPKASDATMAKPADSSVINKCSGSDAILPIDDNLSPGDNFDVLTWFFNNQRVAGYIHKRVYLKSEYKSRATLRTTKDKKHAQLIIKNVTKKDTGVYSLRIKGTRANGSNFTLTRNLTMEVTACDAAIVNQKPADRRVISTYTGSDAILPFDYSLSPGDKVFMIRWIFNDKTMAMYSFNTLLATKDFSGRVAFIKNRDPPQLMIKNVTIKDTGDYSLTITGKRANGSAISLTLNLTLQVTAPPKGKPTSPHEQKQKASQKPDASPPKGKPTSDQEQEQETSKKPDASPPKGKPTSDQEQEQKTSQKPDASRPKGKPTSDQEQKQKASQKPTASRPKAGAKKWKVIFKATAHGGNLSVKKQEPIVIPKVLYDQGKSYQPRSGVFHAPYPGTYYFSAYSGSCPTTGNATVTSMSLMKNDKALAYGRTPMTHKRVKFSAKAVTKLAKGDKVWLRAESAGCYYGDFTSFAGYLKLY